MHQLLHQQLLLLHLLLLRQLLLPRVLQRLEEEKLRLEPPLLHVLQRLKPPGTCSSPRRPGSLKAES